MMSREVLHCEVDGKDLFEDWFDSLKDRAGQAAILRRIERAKDGNFGDHRFVGGGVWEMRVDFGPGYRLYYGEDGPRLVLLLWGGDKGSQVKDIRTARTLWAHYERRS